MHSDAGQLYLCVGVSTFVVQTSIMKKLTICALSGFLFLTANISQAQTGTPTRVIATTEYASDSLGWYPFDSVSYYYSGSRGGYPIMLNGSLQYSGKYDTAYYLAKGTRGNKYYQSGRFIQIFDGHNNALTAISQNYDTTTHLWNNTYRNIYTYDVHNNHLNHISQSWDKTSGTWKTQSSFGYTYDANNNLVTDTTTSWVSGIWQYTVLQLYTYDMHNNLTDVVGMTYSAGSWHNAEKHSYFLNAGNKPDSMTYYSSSGSGWSGNAKVVYTYDSSYNELTDTNQSWSGTSWQNNYCITNAYDIHSNQISQLRQVWDGSGYVNSTIHYQSFNTDNKLDTMTVLFWDGHDSVWKPEYRAVYYYAPITDVKNVNQVAGDMTIYPSPANSYINIDINWKNAQRATLAIYDMNGRLYRQWTANPGLSYYSNIPTGSMPAGNYILKVRGDAGQMAEQFSIVH